MQSLLAVMGVVIVAFAKVFLGWGRLKSIRLLPLEATLDEVRALCCEFPGPIQDGDYADFLEFYGEGQRWEPLTEGYSYRRDDLRRVC